MSNFKKNFRDNIVAPYTKYSLSQEKIGKVLEADSKRNLCTIMYKNIDGILVTKSNVPCKKSSLKGILKSFPKKGDYVELQEVGKIIRITGVVDKNTITEVEQELYDTNSGTSDIGGYLGI